MFNRDIFLTAVTRDLQGIREALTVDGLPLADINRAGEVLSSMLDTLAILARANPNDGEVGAIGSAVYLTAVETFIMAEKKAGNTPQCDTLH